MRERKKANRRQEILFAARELFAQGGYLATTVDAIGERAGISAVTVHNYYGTKSGVLLALVIESDALLCEEIDRRLDEVTDEPIEIAMRFARVVRRHAISYLDRALWRQVLAASIVEGDSLFGRSYHALDRRLAACLERRLERAAATGALASGIDTETLGAALFDVQNVAFTRFVSDDSLDERTIEAWLRRDLIALTGAMP